MPEDILPAIFPTEPTLEIEELRIVDSKISSSTKLMCEFMVVHTNASYTLKFNSYLESTNGRCFAFKGFIVYAILSSW